jgi:hypothetical protein
MGSWAKGDISKIAIAGNELGAPLDIVDPVILSRFSIWSGPGVGGWDMRTTMPGPDDAQFIVDWTQGIVYSPGQDARRYRITMHIDHRDPPQNIYEVTYAISHGVGYVYLPIWSDDDYGRWNTFLIYRKIEGNWFRATDEWQTLAQLILGGDKPASP